MDIYSIWWCSPYYNLQLGSRKSILSPYHDFTEHFFILIVNWCPGSWVPKICMLNVIPKIELICQILVKLRQGRAQFILCVNIWPNNLSYFMLQNATSGLPPWQAPVNQRLVNFMTIDEIQSNLMKSPAPESWLFDGYVAILLQIPAFPRPIRAT